ncbi:MAG: hypothetical protein ACRDOO_02205 [Actinomadura sp.]
MTQRPHPEPTSDIRHERLEALRDAIERTTDLRARLVSPAQSGTGTTTLHVTNLHAARLSEYIGCDLLDGAWWFTWPLTDSGALGPAEDLDAAVKVINHVLAPRM